MGTSVVWVVVECACRILGVSTAAVLCAVGVETLRQGDFHSLAVYLLVCSAGMLVFELSFFVDILLMWCLPCPPKWTVFLLWKKMAKLGGFQKFLYYTLMSVVCFLHPVLVWHAVIPGTMLLLAGFAYFILGKKGKPKEPTGVSDSYEDAATATGPAPDCSGAERTYSFTGRRLSELSYVTSAGHAQSHTQQSHAQSHTQQSHAQSHAQQSHAQQSHAQSHAQATADSSRPVQPSDAPSRRRAPRRVHFGERVPNAAQDEAEVLECQDAEQEETTSDKAPMIRP